MPKYYPDIELETAITWDSYQALQLLLKVHNVFAQLDVIHPAEREKAQSETCKAHGWISYNTYTVPFLGYVYQIEGLGFNLGLLMQFVHQL